MTKQEALDRIAAVRQQTIAAYADAYANLPPDVQERLPFVPRQPGAPDATLELIAALCELAPDAAATLLDAVSQNDLRVVAYTLALADAVRAK